MSNTEDDERCIKVELRDIVWSAVEVDAFNDQRKATYGGRYQDLVITGYNGKYTPRKLARGSSIPPTATTARTAAPIAPKSSNEL